MKIVQFLGIVLMCLFLNCFVEGYASPGSQPDLRPIPRLLYRLKSGDHKQFRNPIQAARVLLHKMNLPHLHLQLLQAASTPQGLLFEMNEIDQVAEILERWKSLDSHSTGSFFKKYELTQTKQRFTE